MTAFRSRKRSKSAGEDFRFFPANQIVEIIYLAQHAQYLKNRPRLSTDQSASIQL